MKYMAHFDNPVVYDLDGSHDLDARVYGAAVAGLAATAAAWAEGAPGPNGVEVVVEPRRVVVGYAPGLSAGELVRRLLTAAFPPNPEQMVSPVSLTWGASPAFRLAVHVGCSANFFSHPQSRRLGDAQTASLGALTLSYQGVADYALPRARRLLPDPTADRVIAQPALSGMVLPGVTVGAAPLTVGAPTALLLQFLPAAAPPYLLRPASGRAPRAAAAEDRGAGTALVYPWVEDLMAYTTRLRAAVRTWDYLDLAAGTSAEAGLRFLTDLSGVCRSASIVALGRAFGDRAPRPLRVVRVNTETPDLERFQVAQRVFGRARWIKNRFAVACSVMPGLIAENLTAHRHWLSGFTRLVADDRQWRELIRMRPCFAALNW